MFINDFCLQVTVICTVIDVAIMFNEGETMQHIHNRVTLYDVSRRRL